MSEEWKSRVQRPADFWFGGYMLSKYQGDTLRSNSPCASDLCHMTLSQVGFLTLARGRYIFPFILCLSFLPISQLFVRPPQTTVLPFCTSFSWGWFDHCLLYNVIVTRVYVPQFFVSSQQRFGATDIKALGTSQLSGLGQTVL